MLSRALTLAGALGVPVTGTTAATDGSSATFSNAAEARAYLLENPAGPDASAAIAALTEVQETEADDGVRLAQASGNSILQQNQNTPAAESETGGGMY